MIQTLHILNGDGTAYNFPEANVPGKILVWREVLMEGPVRDWNDETQFLAQRAHFLDHGYGEAEGSYQEKFVPEFKLLKTAGDFEEIVLWFEYDLFCQVNLIFLLNWFYRHAPQAKLSLVSPGSHPEVEPFYGMGQLSPAQLGKLYAERIPVSGEAVELGSGAWKAYADDPLELQSFMQRTSSFPTELGHLQNAMGAHFRRFPSLENGLNAIESHIIHLLAEGPKVAGELFRHFCQALPEYGLGDMQYFAELKGLMPHWVVMNGEVFALTEDGDSLARGQRNRLEAGFPHGKWLGGYSMNADAEAIFWDESSKRLLRRPSWP